MTKTQIAVTTAALIVGLGVGCKPSPAEEQDRAVEAQREANTEIGEARAEAADQIEEAQKEASKDVTAANKEASQALNERNEKVAEAQREYGREAAEAQQAANEKIRDAKETVGEVKRDLSEWGQEKVRDLDETIEDANVKAQNVGTAARNQFEVSMKEVRAERDQIVMELASVQERATSDVSRVKENLNQRFERLEDRVQEISRKL